MNGLNSESQGLRRIDGRIVRRSWADATLKPLQEITVHAEETVSSFLAYSPPQWPDWSWLLPFNVRRQEIAVAATDAQGRFSLGIPREEIDSVASWRQGRIGHGDFSRPRLFDLAKDLESQTQGGPPAEAIRRTDFLGNCRKRVGRPLTDQIEALFHGAMALSDESVESLLETRVGPPRPAAPPRPQVKELAALARVQGLPREAVDGAQFGRWLGPVWRQTNLYLPLWTLLVEVPDITFRVTAGAGEGVALDSDGFFGVLWTGDPMNELTLALSTAARPEFAEVARPAGVRDRQVPLPASRPWLPAAPSQMFHHVAA